MSYHYFPSFFLSFFVYCNIEFEFCVTLLSLHPPTSKGQSSMMCVSFGRLFECHCFVRFVPDSTFSFFDFYTHRIISVIFLSEKSETKSKQNVSISSDISDFASDFFSTEISIMKQQFSVAFQQHGEIFCVYKNESKHEQAIPLSCNKLMRFSQFQRILQLYK